MATKKESKKNENNLDKLRWLLALSLFVAGLVAYYYYSEQFVFAYRLLALCGVTAVAVAVVATTNRAQAIMQLLKDSRGEIRKVAWPNRQEVTQSSVVVMLVVVLVSVLLWFFDTIFSWLISVILE